MASEKSGFICPDCKDIFNSSDELTIHFEQHLSVPQSNNLVKSDPSLNSKVSSSLDKENINKTNTELINNKNDSINTINDNLLSNILLFEVLNLISCSYSPDFYKNLNDWLRNQKCVIIVNGNSTDFNNEQIKLELEEKYKINESYKAKYESTFAKLKQITKKSKEANNKFLLEKEQFNIKIRQLEMENKSINDSLILSNEEKNKIKQNIILVTEKNDKILSKQENTFNSKLQELSKNMQSLKSNNDLIQKKLLNMTKNVDELQLEKAELLTTLNLKETQYKEYMDSSKRDNNIMVEKYDKLRIELDESQEKEKIATKDLIKIKNSYDSLEEKFVLISKEYEDYKEESLFYKKNYDKTLNEKDTIDKAHKISTKENEKFRKQLIEKVLALNAISESNKTLLDKISDIYTRRWIDDFEVNNCFDCEIQFTLTFRKHHCRWCGKIYCYICLPFSIELTHCNKPSMVCKTCYGEIEYYRNN